MGKKNNKYQKFSRNNDENDEEIVDVSVNKPLKGHGDWKKEYLRAKRIRQDIEYIAAVLEAHHAA
jgi:hypothetical protein